MDEDNRRQNPNSFHACPPRRIRLDLRQAVYETRFSVALVDLPPPAVQARDLSDQPALRQHLRRLRRERRERAVVNDLRAEPHEQRRIEDHAVDPHGHGIGEPLDRRPLCAGEEVRLIQAHEPLTGPGAHGPQGHALDDAAKAIAPRVEPRAA